MAPGIGRKSRAESYTDPRKYLNEIIFPITDGLELLKTAEREAEKAYLSAKNKRSLQQQKLDYAYNGLNQFRK